MLLPSTVNLSDLTWSTPEGHTLFSHLNLAFGPERTGLVGRNGVGKTTLLRLMSGELRPLAGRISIAGRVGFLRQTVQPPPQETIADLFGVTEAWRQLQRAHIGEATLDELAETDWALESRILSALARVGLEAHADTLLQKLSGGQRTRASLAAVSFAEPDLLLLDEPTNNLDREGRTAVIHFLARWRAGAIVVSHDREFLETMDAIVELTSLGATRYGGNWSDYREQKALELAAAQHDLAHAQKRVAEVARNTQESAERKARSDAAGRRKKAKGDTPRINLGRLKDRAEDSGGANARLAERLRTEAQEAAAAARKRIEILQPFSVELPSTQLPGGKTVLELDSISVGYEPGRPVLENLSFTIVGPERVAITGANGSGKTTLLSLISHRLPPWSGRIQVSAEYAMLDQQVSILDTSTSIRDNFRRLNPKSDEQACRASLARFVFRADATLQIVASLSGGQLLRAALACVLGSAKPPPFLILDEPTNHLDIDSIEAVEAGLRAYDGALLVVSHDESFLQQIGITRRLALPSPPR